MSGKMNWGRVDIEDKIFQADVSAYLNALNADIHRNAHNTRIFQQDKKRRDALQAAKAFHTYIVVRSQSSNDNLWTASRVFTINVKDGSVEVLRDYINIVDYKSIPSYMDTDLPRPIM